MNAKKLVSSLRDKRDKILEALPADKREEYRNLTIAIQIAEKELAADKAAQRLTADSQPSPNGDATHAIEQEKPAEESQKHAKLSLADRQTQVVKFLTKNGPATRNQIIEATGVPLGSLGAILGHRKVFEKKGGGLWDLV